MWFLLWNVRMPPIVLGYYRNLGSLRYGNEYCVEFDAVWEKLSFSSSTEAYFNHAVITARRLVYGILKKTNQCTAVACEPMAILGDGWRWFSCLLIWRRPGATGSSRRAGALREEVSHRLRWLLSLREVFSKPSTDGPNRLPDETGASRKGTLSASFISVIVSQWWRSNTIRLDIERPMAWAVALVACRARSVPLLRSLSEAASRPASSLASILAWSTAIECSADAACPAAE